MEKKYNYIIKADSVENVLKGITLFKEGSSVLLINKFGFPGSQLANQLHVHLRKESNSWAKEFNNWLNSYRGSILFEDENSFVFHPEYLKRNLWESINDIGIDFLFHVVELERKDNSLVLFGREGNIEYSFDFYVGSPESDESTCFINLFTENDVKDCNFSQKCNIGYLVQYRSKCIQCDDLDLNRELNQIIDGLLKEGNRPLILPSSFAKINYGA